MVYTIKDIAAEAGVSTTTVSLVLNQKPCRVSQSTRERIVSIAEKHHYSPNLSARTLVKRESRTLGLIVPDISNPYFSELAKGVEREAQKQGYALILCNSGELGKKDVENFKLLVSRQVDAVVLVCSIREEESGYANEFNRVAAASRMPVVQFDRHVIGGDYDTVSIDNRMGGYLAAKLLLTLNYTKVGCITGPLETSSAQQRFQGYCDALKEYGIALEKEWVAHGDYTMESGLQQARLLLNQQVDSIFACNDMMAIGASKALRQCGKRPGINFALVGFDDSPICEYLETPLTTVNQNIYDMGKSACRLAMNAINDKKRGVQRVKQNVCFSPSLVIRETAKKKPDPEGQA